MGSMGELIDCDEMSDALEVHLLEEDSETILDSD